MASSSGTHEIIQSIKGESGIFKKLLVIHTDTEMNLQDF